MIRIIPLALLCAACTPAAEDGPGEIASTPAAEDPAATRTADLATQIDVPTADYARLVGPTPIKARGELNREASAALPRDAKAVGDLWLERLREAEALSGWGLEGKGQDGPVSSISTLMTARDFDAWVAQNGWNVPRHIRWGFVPELVAPMVSDAAASAIKFWPASRIRTGLQLEALLGGKVYMKDGCFWVQQGNDPAKLAWFHAETGLDRDDEGYLVLVDRVTGELRARLGEEMVWAGPNAVDASDDRVKTYMMACDGKDIVNVGNPEAAERMYVRYPHTRPPVANPPPPLG